MTEQDIETTEKIEVNSPVTLPDLMAGIVANLTERHHNYGYNLLAEFNLFGNKKSGYYLFPTPVPYRDELPDSYLVLTGKGFRLIQTDHTPEGEELKGVISRICLNSIREEKEHKTTEPEAHRNPSYNGYFYSSTEDGDYETLSFEPFGNRNNEHKIEIASERASQSKRATKAAKLILTEDIQLILDTIQVNENRAAVAYSDDKKRQERAEAYRIEQERIKREEEVEALRKVRESEAPQFAVAQKISEMLSGS